MVNPTSRVPRLFLLSILLVVVPTALVFGGSGEKKVNTNWFGVAIKGYDPVAYFTEGQAVKGKKEFEYEWQDAKWRFSSAENRDLFAANPEKYAPQYGGF
jgi:YHS domain-containing protein